jgi:hypothetical protein
MHLSPGVGKEHDISRSENLRHRVWSGLSKNQHSLYPSSELVVVVRGPRVEQDLAKTDWNGSKDAIRSQSRQGERPCMMRQLACQYNHVQPLSCHAAAHRNASGTLYVARVETMTSHSTSPDGRQRRMLLSMFAGGLKPEQVFLFFTCRAPPDVKHGHRLEHCLPPRCFTTISILAVLRKSSSAHERAYYPRWATVPPLFFFPFPVSPLSTGSLCGIFSHPSPSAAPPRNHHEDSTSHASLLTALVGFSADSVGVSTLTDELKPKKNGRLLTIV